MANSIKLNDDTYIDASGIRDSSLGRYQNKVNRSIQTYRTTGNSCTIQIPIHTSSSSQNARLGGLILATGQSSATFGLYAIAVNENNNTTLTKIYGGNATVSRSGSSVTLTFEGINYMYGTCLVIFNEEA